MKIKLKGTLENKMKKETLKKMKMKLKSAFSLFLEKTLFNFVFSIHKVKLYKSAIICFVFLGPKLHAISHTILSISFMIFFKSISSIKLEIFNTMQDYPEVFFILYFSIFYFRYSDPFLYFINSIFCY